ncbi:hypothetical protein AOLI_G00056990 [Acnodon oligacanthus]
MGLLFRSLSCTSDTTLPAAPAMLHLRHAAQPAPASCSSARSTHAHWEGRHGNGLHRPQPEPGPVRSMCGEVLLSAYKCQPLPLSAAGCAAKMDYPLISAVRRRSGLVRLMHTEWGNDFTFLQKLGGPVPELLYNRARFIMNRNQTHTCPGTRSVNTVLRLNRR